MRIDLVVRGLEQVQRQVSNAQKQVAFAASRAINDAANKVRAEMPSVLERELDRPKPFTTKSSTFIRYSSRDKLEAFVGIKPLQAAYLRPLIEGGVRKDKPIEQRFLGRQFVPTENLPVDQYGNVSKATQLALVRAATQRGKLWRGRRIFVLEQQRGRLPPGVYAVPAKRTRRQVTDLQALLWFTDRDARYGKRLDWVGEAKRIADAEIVRAFDRRLAEAMRTAR